MNPFRRPKFPLCRTIHSDDDLRLFNVSGVDDFALEAWPALSRNGEDTLLEFACDEEDGPVKVYFGPMDESVEIDLATFRRLLDEAERRLLEMRREHIYVSATTNRLSLKRR